MRLEAGALVTDKVRLIHPLREGGMGTVWVGEHLTLEKRVAVKFVSAELARRSENAVERFKREAKAAAKLKSPHVVTMLDHGVSEDGIPYIVMELLEGETLADRLANGGRLAESEVVAIVSQVARALDEAHGMGIVHRDIKPSNLFLTRAHDEVFVKVLDFGIAKAMERSDAQLTLTEGMVGTLHYMSPEQMSDASTVGPSADLWSLAVVAYHALTGKLPFEGSTPVAVHKLMVAESFTPASDRLGEDRAELDEWFRRALAPDPVDRFQAARELAASLRAIGRTGDAGASVRRRVSSASSEEPQGNPDLGTAEFLASVADMDVKPSSRSVSSKDDRVEPAPSEETRESAREGRDREPAPPSTVKRRRSLAQGVVLGAVAVGVAAWIAYAATRPPPTPASVPTTSTTTATAIATATPTAPTASAAGSTSPAATTAAPTATPIEEPTHKVWPIGCTAANRPCGLGCCMWDRGCEPGSCEEPLPANAQFDVRLAIAAVWPGTDESKRKPLLAADVYIRFGKDGVRRPIFYDRSVRATTEELGALLSAWIQPNLPGLPAIIELPPKGLLRGPERLVLCRGMHLKAESAGNTYWLWLSVAPAGEKPAELCAKVK